MRESAPDAVATTLAFFIAAILLLLAPDRLQTQEDLTRLIEDARFLVATSGDAIWTGFADAPAGVLLIDGEQERLYCHPDEPDGFSWAGMNAQTGCDVYARERVFPPNLLASFPAVDGVPTVVIGTPEATGLDAAQWTRTLVHERFHQLQYSWPGYYPGTRALGLHGDDDTGEWMLNYPFPYADEAVATALQRMAALLGDALTVAEGAGSRVEQAAAIRRYVSARSDAAALVSAADWRYVEFQMWQEGVAAWTEAAVWEHAGEAGPPLRARLATTLEQLDVADLGRVAFYALGAGEAALLDSAGEGWREHYWLEPFQLGRSIKRLSFSVADPAAVTD